jgi:hypothetical protein
MISKMNGIRFPRLNRPENLYDIRLTFTELWEG